jgi:hypothetical protein
LLLGITQVPEATAQADTRSQLGLEETQAVSTYLAPAQASLASNPSALPAGCMPTGGKGGLKPGTYNTTVAGLKAIVIVGKGYDPSTPTYLAFYLHGDGGIYDQIKNSGNVINKFINTQSWIIVSPRSPNGMMWWTNYQGDHKTALTKVFDEMFAKYNVCRHIVFGTGGSGGAEFWSSQFFPAKGGTYPAHMVLACGGSAANTTKLLDLAQNTASIKRSTFYYVYGTKDKLYPSILKSIQSYKVTGYTVYTKELVGAGHCNKWPEQGWPTWLQQTVTLWKAMANQQGVPLK